MMEMCTEGMKHSFVLFFQVNSLSSKASEALRSSLRACGMELKFVSPNLLKVYLRQREELKALKDIIVGPTMMVYTNKEPKEIKENGGMLHLLNENKLLLICGVLNYQLLAPEGVLKVVQTLPPSNLLREHLAQTLQPIAGKIVSTLQNPFIALSKNLEQIINQKEN